MHRVRNCASSFDDNLDSLHGLASAALSTQEDVSFDASPVPEDTV